MQRQASRNRTYRNGNGNDADGWPVSGSVNSDHIIPFWTGADAATTNTAREPLGLGNRISGWGAMAFDETVDQNIGPCTGNTITSMEKEVGVADRLGQTDKVTSLRFIDTGVKEKGVQTDAKNRCQDEGSDEDINAYRCHLPTYSQERESSQSQRRGTRVPDNHHGKNGTEGRKHTSFPRGHAAAWSNQACAR